MPEMNWQLVVCGLIVAWAGVVLARGFLRLVRGRSGGCQSGGCGKCPAGGEASGLSSQEIVPLQPLEMPVGDDRKG